MLANHFNERTDKRIMVVVDQCIHETGTLKFGAFVGDRSRIGANAVTTPGTWLPRGTIVPRLGLVDQVAERSRLARLAGRMEV